MRALHVVSTASEPNEREAALCDDEPCDRSRRIRHAGCVELRMHYPDRGTTARRTIQFVQFASVLALASCTHRTDSTPTVSDNVATASTPTIPRDGRVVLVTVDGARWQDVFEGSNPAFSGAPRIPPEELMPRTLALAATRGVALGATQAGCAHVHTAGASNVSLPGYLEIFTGHASHCLDNNCAQVQESVLDEAMRMGVQGVASIGAWPVLSRAVSGGSTGVFVSVGRSWPEGAPAGAHLGELAMAGNGADAYPGLGGYRPDAATAAIALEYLRVARPALLHVGLGDTDEYGHRSDYASYLDALRRADALIGSIADVLATMGEDGDRTTVVVTPDHGRNADFRDHGAFHPESARTFLIAFGARLVPRGIGCPTHDITLADIAPTIRVLMGLPRDTSEGGGAPIDFITETK
jgi:hypothetical protein